MPLTPDDVERFTAEFDRIRPTYERFSRRVADLLITLIEDIDVKVQTVESRAKSVESFRDKLTNPKKSYVDPLKEIFDLSGIRIIVYYPEDVDKIAELVRAEFDVDSTRSVDKRKTTEPDRFGYESLHLVVNLKKDRKMLKEWAKV